MSETSLSLRFFQGYTARRNCLANCFEILEIVWGSLKTVKIPVLAIIRLFRPKQGKQRVRISWAVQAEFRSYFYFLHFTHGNFSAMKIPFFSRKTVISLCTCGWFPLFQWCSRVETDKNDFFPLEEIWPTALHNLSSLKTISCWKFTICYQTLTSWIPTAHRQR